MAEAGVRRAVHAEFQAQGLLLDKEALALLAQFVASTGATDATVSQLLDAREAVADGVLKINAAVARQLVEKLSGESGQVDPIQVVSAFDAPRIRFDPIRKAFFRDERPPALFGTAQDKFQVYCERLHLLQQRLARNPRFTRPVFGALEAKQYVQLTEVTALLGAVGQRSTVLGFITQPEDGRFSLEDLSGSVPVDLSGARTASGFYVENCIVAAEGQLRHDGVFAVEAVGMPPTEPREDSLAAAKGLDFFGGRPLRGEALAKAQAWEAAHGDDRVVLLSDVWLDRPATLAALDAVLTGFELLDEPPSVFVLLGDFHSPGRVDAAAATAGFDALAELLAAHPRALEASRFVFVPGPGDPGPGAVLPRPPLPEAVTASLRAAVPGALFASNPCRLRYGSQELLLLRDDLQKRLRRLCLRAPVEGGASERADLSAADCMFQHLAMTVAQQSHLCPVPLEQQAVYWQHDHALRVYPLPHALVLADSAPAAEYTERKSGCVCINPGSLQARSFAAYSPGSRQAELCEVPDAA